MRILYVGSPHHLPEDVADCLRDMGEDWQITMVASGDDAMAAAAQASFDVVVAAPDLPGLSVATLLSQVRTLRPDTLRISLIDPAGGNRAVAARVLSVAHRFLPVPVAAEALLEAVASLEELREVLDSPRLHEAIGRIERLPTPPQLYLKLMRALEDDEDSSAASIAALVMNDPAIAAKVLQLSNSAFFNGGRTITDLRTAVTRLGVATLRDLVLACEVYTDCALPVAERAAIQRRALVASRLAARLLPASSAELGATAALLADIGLLLPGVRNEHQPANDGDADLPGNTEAGAYLLGLWGLPMPIIEAVAFHRQPQRSSTRSFWVTGAVHVATALAANEPVDEAYLTSVGVIDKLPAWRELAHNVLAQDSEG